MTHNVSDNYAKLAALLGDRQSWRPEDGGRCWAFGLDGAARLVITPEMEGFLLYRADQDSSQVFPRIEQVEQWLVEHEQEHAGLTPLQEEYKRALEEMRALEEAQARGQDEEGESGPGDA